jgi:hypothetical protein
MAKWLRWLFGESGVSVFSCAHSILQRDELLLLNTTSSNIKMYHN